MQQDTTQRARVEYWRECYEAMQTQLDGLRRRYAEARESGAPPERLRELRERGEKMVSRVENGERMIAEEEALLELQAVANQKYGGCVACASEPEGGLCFECSQESDFNAYGTYCACSAPDVAAGHSECPIHPEPDPESNHDDDL